MKKKTAVMATVSPALALLLVASCAVAPAVKNGLGTGANPPNVVIMSRIDGTVTFKAGDPAGVEVAAYPVDALPGGATYTAKTDSSGHFALTLPQGTYNLIATKVGSSYRAVQWAVAAATSVNLDLTPTGTLQGAVTASPPFDLTGTLVFVPGTSFMATTDQLGNYTMTLVPVGTVSIEVRREGYAPAIASVGVQPAQTTTAPVLHLSQGNGPTPSGPPAMDYYHLWVGAHTSDCLTCHFQDTGTALNPFVYDNLGNLTTTRFSTFMPPPAIMAGVDATSFAAGSCLACHPAQAAQDPPVSTLYSVKTTQPISPANFGSEAAWSTAPATVITVHNVWDGTNPSFPMVDVPVTVQALYDTTNVYFKAVYADTSQSLSNSPWLLGTDGNWTRPGFAAQQRDDKFLVAWNMNDSTANFNSQGCAVVCHDSNFNAAVTPNMYTNGASELLDLWRGGTTSPTGIAKIMNDNFISNTAIHSDAGTSASVTNASKSFAVGSATFSVPTWGFLSQQDQVTQGQYWLDPTASAALDPLSSNYVVGSGIPSALRRNPLGSIADVHANARWENGKWTWVYYRAQTNSNPAEDVQFSDLSKSYFFALAIMNHTNIAHGIQYGTTAMVFSPPAVVPTPAPSPSSAPSPGQALYQANCLGCHGTSAQGGIGPNVQKAAAATITSAIATVPSMQSISLTAGQINDLAAYLATLP